MIGFFQLESTRPSQNWMKSRILQPLHQRFGRNDFFGHILAKTGFLSRKLLSQKQKDTVHWKFNMDSKYYHSLALSYVEAT